MNVEGGRMRTFLIFASAALAFAAPAGAASRNFGITDFSKVRVDGPFKVSLKTGVAPYAKASGSPDALDRVAIDVRGDTLVVHSNASSWGGYPGKDFGPVEISVGTHDLTNAWLNGAGSLSIDRVKGLSFGLSVQGSGGAEIGEVSADQMNVSLIGTASAKLQGQTRKLTALVRGMSTLSGAGLTAHDATIGAEGTATIDANVTDSASVSASGTATIRFAGQPSCTLKVVGSTSVSGCR
jgi:Putative auto-transporter adhesin, head GIN domain